jgi:EmrB/QacA subfamily drug resistance transporter
LLKLPVTTVALIAVCSGYIIGPMGMASVNVAIPALAEDLQANATKVGWLPTLYLLSSVMFMLPAGKLADNFGRKRIYTLGIALNVLASLMCSLAATIDGVLVWRFVQGAAGAMIFGTGIAIITSCTPERKRGAALGIVAACVYIGLTIAPAIGGWLTELFGWRAVFYFQIPLCLALIAFIKLMLHGEWKNDERARFDWIGAGIFALFTLALVYGLSLLPSLSGALLLCVAGASLLSFLVHQSRSQSPLIRPQMFKESRVFSLSLSTSFFMYASNFAIIFLLSLYLQYIKGFSPAYAGKILMVQALAMAIVAPFAGRLADRFESRIVATIGCSIVALGFVLLNQLNMTSTATYIVCALLLVGFGFGLFSTPNNNAIMGAVKRHEVGIASASMNLSRTTGNLVGMSIVNLMMHYYLGDQSLSTEQNPALMSTISLALMMSLGFVLLACVISSLRGRQLSSLE